MARRQNSGNPFHSSILEVKDITNSQNRTPKRYILKKTVTEYIYKRIYEKRKLYQNIYKRIYIKENCNRIYKRKENIYQMWLDQLPLLTKGPFALMYGGQDIIDQVKIES